MKAFILFAIVLSACAETQPPTIVNSNAVYEAVCYNGRSDCYDEASKRCHDGYVVVEQYIRQEGRPGDYNADMRFTEKYVCKVSK